MPNRYQKRKAAARQKAQDWQQNFANRDCSYGELASDQQMLERLARRYGLVNEFRENGII